MNNDYNKTEILIVGAGIAGLCAATDLQNKGHEVLVIDKGRGLGGRVASRRITTPAGEARFDHGAQFFTARTERFTTLVQDWLDAGVAKEWYRTKGGEITSNATGHPRWCGQPSITAITKHLATPLTVQKQARLSSLVQSDSAWITTLESGEIIHADAVIMTPPVPQVLDLLESSSFDIPETLNTQLKAITYERCIAVMAVLDSASGIEEPGTYSPEHKDIALIIDNQFKGISDIPALTIHATPEFSLRHWDEERQSAGAKLLDSAKQYLGDVQINSYQTHGWLYSKPHKVEEASHLVLQESPTLLIGGDAFGAKLTGSYVEARVEGAALSGWATAEALARLV